MPETETPVEAATRLKAEITAVATNVDEKVKRFNVHDDGKKITVTALTEDRNGAWTFVREAPYTLPTPEEDAPAVADTTPAVSKIPTDVDLAAKDTSTLGKTDADVIAEKEAQAPLAEALEQQVVESLDAAEGNHDPDPPKKSEPEPAAEGVPNPGDVTVGEQAQQSEEAAKNGK